MEMQSETRRLRTKTEFGLEIDAESDKWGLQLTEAKHARHRFDEIHARRY